MYISCEVLIKVPSHPGHGKALCHRQLDLFHSWFWDEGPSTRSMEEYDRSSTKLADYRNRLQLEVQHRVIPKSLRLGSRVKDVATRIPQMDQNQRGQLYVHTFLKLGLVVLHFPSI